MDSYKGVKRIEEEYEEEELPKHTAQFHLVVYTRDLDWHLDKLRVVQCNYNETQLKREANKTEQKRD